MWQSLSALLPHFLIAQRYVQIGNLTVEQLIGSDHHDETVDLTSKYWYF